MKSEAEVTKMLGDVKESLIDTNDEQTYAAQGFARALRWVLNDTEDEGNKDDPDE